MNYGFAGVGFGGFSKGSKDRSKRRMVAEEMIRIDVNLLNNAAQSQPNDTPIISGCAPPACLPSIHPFASLGVLIRKKNAASGLKQIFFLREKLVICEQG